MSYDVPHLKTPITLGDNGRFVTAEQDSEDEVAQCVEAIVRTPIGSRDIEPEFGIPDQAFDVDPQSLADAIAEWEPRAAAEITEEEMWEMYEARINVDIDVRGSE